MSARHEVGPNVQNASLSVLQSKVLQVHKMHTFCRTHSTLNKETYLPILCKSTDVLLDSVRKHWLSSNRRARGVKAKERITIHINCNEKEKS